MLHHLSKTSPPSEVLQCWLYVAHWYYFASGTGTSAVPTGSTCEMYFVKMMYLCILHLCLSLNRVLQSTRFKIVGPAQWCKIRDVQDFWGTNFQRIYQYSSIHNSCVAWQRKVCIGLHGEEYHCHMCCSVIKLLLSSSTLFVEDMKIAPFRSTYALRGSNFGHGSWVQTPNHF